MIINVTISCIVSDCRRATTKGNKNGRFSGAGDGGQDRGSRGTTFQHPRHHTAHCPFIGCTMVVDAQKQTRRIHGHLEILFHPVIMNYYY